MEFIKNNINISIPVSEGRAEFGVEGDIIVPDVLPDILKIVQVDGSAVITDKEINGGKLCCKGKLDLKIIYIPEDAECGINSIVTAFDFEHSPSGALAESSSYINVCADVSRIDFQLTNSRKLKIKSAVKMNYSITNAETLEIVSDTCGDQVLELKKNAITVYGFEDFRDTNFLLRESLEIPSGQNSAKSIIRVDASIYDTEVKLITGRAVVKGICGVNILYTDTMDSIRYNDYEVPFTEIIDLEKSAEDTMCEAEYCINDISYRLEADSDGDMRIVFSEILVGVKISAYKHHQFEYVEDCYCPGKCIEVESTAKTLERVVASGTSSCTLREIIPGAKGSPEITGIYSLVAKPVIENIKTETDMVCVEGKVECYCLYICKNGENPMHSVYHEIRFCENMDMPGAVAETVCKAKVDIAHKNYALNSAGETEIKISLMFDVISTENITVPIISNIDIKEKEDDDRKGIVIYFTDENDDLWKVSKSYTVPIKSVMELNNLQDECLTPGTKLLIPSV